MGEKPGFKVFVRCEYCNCIISGPFFSKNYPRWCDNVCKKRWEKKNVKRYCKTCGGELPPSSTKKRLYCSRRCLEKSYSPPVTMGRKWSEEQVNRWNKAMSDRQGWERLKNLMTWQQGFFVR